FSWRNHTLDVPGRLVDQYPTSGPGGAARQPVPLGREVTIAVRPQSAHFDLGERGAPELWVIDHAPMFGPPRSRRAGKARSGEFSSAALCGARRWSISRAHGGIGHQGLIIC